MSAYLLVAFLGSLAGSGITLAVAYLLYRRVWEPQLEARLVVLQQEFEQHVKNGVLAAGEELLPAFRQNVADGFRDAIKDLHPVGLAGDAAKVVTSAADLVSSGLSNLFGLKPRQ